MLQTSFTAGKEWWQSIDDQIILYQNPAAFPIDRWESYFDNTCYNAPSADVVDEIILQLK